MKILHCCLAAFYIDNYGYQENILPKMHKLQGHDVMIVASTETYKNNSKLGYVEPSSYHTGDGIPITRLPYIKWVPHKIVKKLRIYKGLYQKIETFNPDIIFLHDLQFVSIKEIAIYARKNPDVKIYIDGHTDFINSAKNWLSRNILHGIVYKNCAKVIEPYTKKFYGVLPLRVDFFKTMYNIPTAKLELLVMGIDDNLVDFSRKTEICNSMRESLNISDSDFVIVTGGKIDERKKIHTLMRAVRNINQKNIKLIIFGTPDEKMKYEVQQLSNHASIINVGWISSEKVYDYLFAADLAVFPGTHSVLWEQAVGVGLPSVFKRWEGIQHIDLGGNCLFIDDNSEDEIQEIIIKIIKDRKLYLNMKYIAEEKGVKTFSYYDIAKRAIEVID